ncbi:hypothetical protein SAMN05216420_103148 [Nitrosospira sp. Nl5]|nr:hypothetical protein SAMN05216420_103148 [Nitrosospira sp. Nl5]
MVESNPGKVSAGRRNVMMLDGRLIHGAHFIHLGEWVLPTDGAALLWAHLHHLTMSLRNGIVK